MASGNSFRLRDFGCDLVQARFYATAMDAKHGRASKAPVKEEREEGRCISDAYKRRVRELREEGGESLL